MANFISEDDIEQAILSKLKKAPFDYNILICDPDPSKRDDLNDGTMRISKKQCVLPEVLKASLIRINPNITIDVIDKIVSELSQDYSNTDLTSTNYSLYNKLRNNIQVSVRRNGKIEQDFLKLIDFENPSNNTFTAVSQMWIQGKINYRRPDVLIFVNGLPLVFIELKNSIVKVEEAYNKNLTDYIKDIPNLFAWNQICVLSNGLETRLGAFNASYDFFFEWLKVKSESEKVNREEIRNKGISIEYFIDGLLEKNRLIDYIENFILFQNQSLKIIAKNHQFLGVNNLIESVKNREELNGKLGVFWHTQGSGKSYSMVMFARKVKRKIPGNFTFLVITDRDDLDTQIYKNFLRTETIGKTEECKPKSGSQLREYLQSNKSFVFTLIHKFKYDKGKQYPVLSTRNDIIVMVDEAHRTQYKDLAENMRTALPNANFIAFTGTPLLGSKKLTNQWFGNYVSEYNFAQSVEDGSTVPLYYSRRVPEVNLVNNFLDDDVVDIIEDENLNDAEQRVLENSTSKILEVIKRDDRLEKIAKDIAHHFPRRGYLGKGMVVSVDKFTAVKMYDKVQKYWALEKQDIIKQRNSAKTKEERDNLTSMLNYMNNVQMAVVVSEGEDEDNKFQAAGLDISKHRKFMNEITQDGKDIEDRFKDKNDPFQLVFVCSMWLTGFDVPTLSTLYLDKPMKGHTLMQTIARANRVSLNKPCGIIVDYVNVFKFMKQALNQYALPSNDGDDVLPVKDIDKLIKNLDDVIDESNDFLKNININLDEIIGESSTFEKLNDLEKAYDTILSKDANKDRFKVLTNLMCNLYEASKPEIFEKHWYNEYFAPICYLHDLFYGKIDNEKIEKAKQKMQALLDTSVTANNAEDQQEVVIHESKVIDLTKLDVDGIAKKIKEAPYKNILVDDLRAFIEKTLEQMINKNQNRIEFSQRYKSIIDRYNAGGTENEDYYEQLLKLIFELQKEQERPNLLGLTEEELEIYDLLIKGRKLTNAEEQKVKLAAKNLYNKIITQEAIFVVDWYKDEQPTAKVKSMIEDSLDEYLPDSYDKDVFASKSNLILSLLIDKAVQGLM